MSEIEELLISLIEAGWQVAIRKTKGGIRVECQKWDADEHKSAYGSDVNIISALQEAWIEAGRP